MIDNLLIKILPIERLNRLRLAKASKGKLKAEFQDEHGRWWFTFGDEQDMPLSRIAAQQTHLQYLAAGLSGKMFNDAMETLTECLANSDIVHAGVIVHDLKETPKKIINLHALINVIAANYVRSDEEPNEFNETIHKEKCDWILEQVENGTFFLSHPSFIRSLNPFKVSGQHLKSILVEFQRLLKMQKQRLDIIRSMNAQKEST